MYVAVETRPGIPARSLLEVFQLHLDPVLAGDGDRRQVRNERVVSVGPVGDLAAVHPHAGVAHRAVEEQHVAPSGGVRNRDRRPVASLADEGKPAGAAGFECLFLFAVLLHGHDLQVVLPVERSVDRPVVRDPDLLPSRRGVGIMPGAELPRPEQPLAARMPVERKHPAQRGKHSQNDAYAHGRYSLKASSASVGRPLSKAPSV